MARQRPPNWGEIEASFKRGESAAAIAGRYIGLTPGQVSKRASRGKWAAARPSVAEFVSSECIASSASEAARWVAEHVRVTGRLVAECSRLVDRLEAEGADLLDAVAAINGLSASLKRVVETQRLSLGIQPGAQADDTDERPARFVVQRPASHG